MIFQCDGQENSPRILRYHQLNLDGTDVTQADVDSMTLKVWETETGTQMTAVGGESLVVADCVFDTLQSWDEDADGYNVQVPVSGSYLATGGRTYRVEVKVQPPESGQAWYLQHVEIKTEETYSE